MPKIQELFDLIDVGKNLLFHGPGGTGKSFDIKTIYESYGFKKIIMVAPTGIASVNLGESTRTIGSIFKVPPKNIGNMLEEEIQEEIKNIVASHKYNKNLKIDMLIVDEISMVGKFYIDVMDAVLRSKNNPDKVFGGVQVIFSGDYYQLSPVKDAWGFESEAWDKLNLLLVNFEESKRYDNEFTFNFMKRLRTNQLTEEDKQLLEERCEAYKRKEHQDLEIEPIKLYSHRASVNNMNNTNLLKLEGKMHTSVARDKIIIKSKNPKLESKVKNLLNGLCDKEINYKVGAKIMIIKNISLEERLVNGILGIILDIDAEHIKIKIDDGSIHWLTKCVFEIRTNDYVGTREQYPFRTAWAITIHKCQGISLTAAIVNLEKVFVPGQAYVAISRVKDINKLFIMGEIDYDKITSNDKLPKELITQ